MSTTTEPKQDRSRATRQRLLEVDDSDPQSRALIQATLDLSRGLALANLITDDSKRRRHVVVTWADHLADALNVTD